ncbi:hypothetical protein KY304_01370 [Candidatus Woesearchaeota archaeon]|nr:hypothetical protein [Candidatus Woesearchaeota archaeon]MBW2978743.1 hypothetical protein [Candidatus Woesearchaeota archaeon]
MKTKVLLIIAILLLAVSVKADEGKIDFEVPLTESAFARCQNGILESSESCDLGTKKNPADHDLCAEMGKILKIVQVCRSETCSCFPDRMDCGNGIREGAEWCDPGETQKEDPEKNDLCPQLSELLGRNMTCNPDTCLCAAVTNLAESAVCGDGKIEFNEECEYDSDCDENEECKNCKCLNMIPEMNQSELDELLNQSDIPTPEEKEIIKMQEKKEFDYHDLVGVAVPEFFYSDFRNSYVNVYVEKQDSDYIIGVQTKHNVVQEIIDGGYEEPTMIVNVAEQDAQAVINSEDRLNALENSVGDTVIYRPTGLFARMWFWFKGLFR